MADRRSGPPPRRHRRYALAALALALVITLWAIPRAPRVETDLSPARMLVRDDPDEAFRKVLEEAFGTTWDPIILIFHAPDAVLSRQHLETLRGLALEIEALAGVQRTVHPGNVEIAFGDADRIEIEQIFPAGASQQEVVERRSLASQHRLLRRRLLSSDAGTAVMIVDVDELAPAPRRALVDAIEERIEARSWERVEVLASGLPVVHAEYARLVESSQARLLPLAALAVALLLFPALPDLVWVTRSANSLHSGLVKALRASSASLRPFG